MESASPVDPADARPQHASSIRGEKRGSERSMSFIRRRQHAASVRGEKSRSESFRLTRSSRGGGAESWSSFRKERAGTAETVVGELEGRSFDDDDDARRGNRWHELVAREAARMADAPERRPDESREDPGGRAPDRAPSGTRGGRRGRGPAEPEESGRRGLLSRLGKAKASVKKLFKDDVPR